MQDFTISFNNSRLGAFLLAFAFIFLASHIGAAEAGFRFKQTPKVSDALEGNGFETLKLALDLTELTPALDSNRVTIFAPTNDVFADTAEALGCTDAIDLATRLINTPVGDSNALAVILTYHARLGLLRSSASLLRASPITTVSGDSIVSGVNASGLFVEGAANSSVSSITSESIDGYRWVIYPIDTLLLPFAPPAGLCD